MAFSRRLLSDDERVVVSTRTHVKALLGPAFVLILVAAAAGFLSTFPSGRARPLLVAVVWLLALLVVLPWVVRPFLRWLTTTYTVTDRRLITRSGVLTRRGHDIPLARVSDVSYERGVWDRVLGCGTLLVSDASEQGRVELHDIPQVERVHLLVSDQLFALQSAGRYDGPDRQARRFDDGT